MPILRTSLGSTQTQLLSLLFRSESQLNHNICDVVFLKNSILMVFSFTHDNISGYTMYLLDYGQMDDVQKDLGYRSNRSKLCHISGAIYRCISEGSINRALDT